MHMRVDETGTDKLAARIVLRGVGVDLGGVFHRDDHAGVDDVEAVAEALVPWLDSEFRESGRGQLLGAELTNITDKASRTTGGLGNALLKSKSDMLEVLLNDSMHTSS